MITISYKVIILITLFLCLISPRFLIKTEYECVYDTVRSNVITGQTPMALRWGYKRDKNSSKSYLKGRVVCVIHQTFLLDPDVRNQPRPDERRHDAGKDARDQRRGAKHSRRGRVFWLNSPESTCRIIQDVFTFVKPLTLGQTSCQANWSSR